MNICRPPMEKSEIFYWCFICHRRFIYFSNRQISVNIIRWFDFGKNGMQSICVLDSVLFFWTNKKKTLTFFEHIFIIMRRIWTEATCCRLPCPKLSKINCLLYWRITACRWSNISRNSIILMTKQYHFGKFPFWICAQIRFGTIYHVSYKALIRS